MSRVRPKLRAAMIAAVLTACSSQEPSATLRAPCAVVHKEVASSFPVSFPTKLGNVVLHSPAVRLCDGGPFAALCVRLTATVVRPSGTSSDHAFRGSCSLEYEPSQRRIVAAWPCSFEGVVEGDQDGIIRLNTAEVARRTLMKSTVYRLNQLEHASLQGLTHVLATTREVDSTCLFELGPDIE